MKLASKYYEPFPIIEKVGKVTYMFQLPSESIVYPIFHVFLLKKKTSLALMLLPTFPPVDNDGQFLLELIDVLRRRMMHFGDVVVTQWLIHWSNLTVEELTWEDATFIQSQFVTFNPEGQGLTAMEYINIRGLGRFSGWCCSRITLLYMCRCVLH